MGRLFGTNGVRGVVGKEMTADLALRLGMALGSTLAPGPVLVGGDARVSTPMLQDALSAGLMAAGARVLDGGMAPTPALQHCVRACHYRGGAVVTASHNPPDHNGVKAVRADGRELTRAEEAKVEDLYFSDRPLVVPWDRVGDMRPSPGVNEWYVDAVVARADRALLAGSKLKVLLDTGNGVSGLTAPHALRKLGLSLETLNAQPDGTFPAHPSEPTPENVKATLEVAKRLRPDLTIVHDGDADRAVFADETGAYVPGERGFALLAADAVRRAGGGIVVTGVSSSLCVEKLVESAGGKVVYTAVGSPVIAERMVAEKAIFGGEENGGCIVPEHLLARDALMTSVRMLELLAREGKTLSRLLAAVPEFHTVKLKVACPNDRKPSVLDAFAKGFRGKDVDRTDGVKARLSTDSWVLVRPSGTEPIFRVYAEARTTEEARRLAEEQLAVVERLARA